MSATPMKSRAASGIKRAEARARYYTRDEATRIGWNTSHPSDGGLFLEEQEVVDHFPVLRQVLRGSRPDFGVLDESRALRMIVECKNEFDKIDVALKDGQAYANAINETTKFFVPVVVGVAGTPDTRVQIRCQFLRRNRWVALKSHGYNLTQLPTLQELETAIQNGDGTTDVELPDEREFYDAAIKISNILRLAKIVESDRPRVIGAIILALYQDAFSQHPEAVLEAINANVRAAVYGKFTDMQQTSREFLVETLKLSTETRSLASAIPDIVQQLERLNVRSIMRSGVDFLGNFYEAFLRYGCDAKSLGIVFTPRHITRYCASLVNVSLGMSVYDAACGTGGFLVSAFDRMWSEATTPRAKKKVKEAIFGCDTNATVWALAVLNMFFRGDGKSDIRFKSCFDNPQYDDDQFDRSLLNPPFSQEGEPETAFIDHALAKLRPGGELAVVVPTGVVVDSSLAAWRKSLMAAHQVLGVISMPVDLFYPVGAPTVIMIIKANSPDNERGVFFARVENDGFVISKKRRVPAGGSQLEVIEKMFIDYRQNGSIGTVQGVACVVDRGVLENGEEMCAEALLPSASFSVDKYLSHRNELLRQITMAVASNPDVVEEIVVGYDELLATGRVEGRPEHRTTLNHWFDIVSAKTTKAKSIPQGTVPYVSSSDRFNSIVNYLQPPDSQIIDYPSITVTGFGAAYIQPWRYCARGGAGSAVRVLQPKFSMTLSELMWFAAQINDERWRVFYGRMASAARLKRYQVEPPPEVLPPMAGLGARLIRFRDDLVRVSTSTPSPDETFQALSRSWKVGRGRTSSARKMAQHPAYRQIVSMGMDAVKLIFREFKEGRIDHWFVALHEITGESPVSQNAAGRLPEMAQAWLEWGRSKGLVDDSGSD